MQYHHTNTHTHTNKLTSSHICIHRYQHQTQQHSLTHLQQFSFTSSQSHMPISSVSNIQILIETLHRITNTSHHIDSPHILKRKSHKTMQISKPTETSQTSSSHTSNIRPVELNIIYQHWQITSYIFHTTTHTHTHTYIYIYNALSPLTYSHRNSHPVLPPSIRQSHPSSSTTIRPNEHHIPWNSKNKIQHIIISVHTQTLTNKHTQQL